MAVTARQHFKRMRGGANAHLLLGDDEEYYVVKFRNNPQHPRILVNELVCSVLLQYLQIPTPGWTVVNVPESLVAATPELVMEAGAETRRCEAGLQFGSRFPVDPARRAVYDYLPVSLLRLLLNADSFLGIAAFDKWVSNANGRQAIFFRDRASRWMPLSGQTHGAAIYGRQVPPRSLVYVVNMIDHGFAFNAQNWTFTDSPDRGLYTRREVYESVTGFDSFEPWLDRIVHCTPDALDDAYKRVPPKWFGSDWDALEGLLEELHRRRKGVPELLWSAKHDTRDPFPNWTSQVKYHAVSAAGMPFTAVAKPADITRPEGGAHG